MSRVVSRSGCPGRAPATLKARKLIAPIAPVAARSAAAWSAASLLVPYGLFGARTAVSLIGCWACAPYTRQVDARTSRPARAGTVALRRRAPSPCSEERDEAPQALPRTDINWTSDGLSVRVWACDRRRLGGPIAQCNRAPAGPCPPRSHSVSARVRPKIIPKAGQAPQVGVPGGVDLFPIGAVHPL